MITKYRSLLISLLTILLLFTCYGGYKVYQLFVVGTAYMAKMICSLVFISGIDASIVITEDIYDPMLEYFSYKIDYKKKTVTAFAPFQILSNSAYYTDYLGATLGPEDTLNSKITDIFASLTTQDSINHTAEWPVGNTVREPSDHIDIDYEELLHVVNEAFTEPIPGQLRRTRAVVIVYKEKILAEKYAEPFNKETRFLGWSMTKSITNALVGILIKEHKLSLSAPPPVPEWEDSDDPRQEIKLEHLLRMTSGLDFEESYQNPLSDVVWMLYCVPDVAHYAAQKPLINIPGNTWSYSSGTSNIISRIIRHTFAGKNSDYLRFPFQMLFHRIGMFSAVMETDPSGTFVGSSFSYATARDWARFGLLYLQDGLWLGEKILPEWWVQFSRSRTTNSKKGRYAAHFWLNPIPEKDQVQPTNDLLRSLFFASGHHGQFISILPEHELVIVRLGLSKHSDFWDQNQFIRDILSTFKQ